MSKLVGPLTFSHQIQKGFGDVTKNNYEAIRL